MLPFSHALNFKVPPTWGLGYLYCANENPNSIIHKVMTPRKERCTKKHPSNVEFCGVSRV
jgi:hypothetical protein